MKKHIILASGSPRRKELMEMMGLGFEVNTGSDFVERIPASIPVEDVPSYLAKGKSESFRRPLKDDEILVSADTVVICEGRIFGKPADDASACRMLEQLSGKTHKVVTALCLRDATRTVVRSDTSLVTFKELSGEEIRFYVDRYHPTDKAGGYGIQEWIGLVGISRIEGSFYTIMGLPTHLLSDMLKEFGY